MRELGRVCLAISSFRNDDALLQLLGRQRDALRHFARVLVVDSLGTGELPRRLSELAPTARVEYHCFPENLGSAGNLARRLSLAGSGPGDFAYGLNHDGDLQPDAIVQLVRLADSAIGPLGALFPLRRMTERGGKFDRTGQARFPFTAIRSKAPPREPLSDVFWSSSNGALYALEPVRKGLLPFAELWMGYEDLGYGWLLHQNGYRQYVARDVRIDDGYEYRKSVAGPITNKPSWYAYYFARNLLLAASLTRQPFPVRTLALARVTLELGVTLALRNEKKARLLATAEGIVDGLRHRTGKWRRP